MQQFNIFTQHRHKQADALDEIVRLLQECKAITRQLQRRVQPQAQSEQQPPITQAPGKEVQSGTPA